MSEQEQIQAGVAQEAQEVKVEVQVTVARTDSEVQTVVANTENAVQGEVADVKTAVVDAETTFSETVTKDEQNAQEKAAAETGALLHAIMNKAQAGERLVHEELILLIAHAHELLNFIHAQALSSVKTAEDKLKELGHKLF